MLGQDGLGGGLGNKPGVATEWHMEEKNRVDAILSLVWSLSALALRNNEYNNCNCANIIIIIIQASYWFMCVITTDTEENVYIVIIRRLDD